jgi:hypothetical protein
MVQLSQLSPELAGGALPLARARPAGAPKPCAPLSAWECDNRGEPRRAVVEPVDPEAPGIEPPQHL